jgi:hypothetical protein
VRNKTESPINTPDPVGFKDFFLYHDRPLFKIPSGICLFTGLAGRCTNPAKNL